MGGGTPPGILYEYQNKRVAKFAFRICMKRRGIDRDTLTRFEVATIAEGRWSGANPNVVSGTSRLSVNKHMERYHEFIAYVKYFIRYHSNGAGRR
jgi:hypothetical protein